MSEEHLVCMTFEAAVDKAIEMEEKKIRNYLQTMRKLGNPHARDMLREAALEDLTHKHRLEKALLDGSLAPGEESRPVPTMNLDYLFGKKEIGPQADVREALAYAIHLEKESMQFYRQFSEVCAGAPMATFFSRLFSDKSRHLRALEDLYEEHFLTED